MKIRSTFLCGVTLAALVATTLTACSGGGADDPVGGDSDADGSGGAVSVYAYAAPKAGFDRLIPAFQETDAGEDVVFRQSYDASDDQSRKVRDGAGADIVNFSVEPDITRLVEAGRVDEEWNAGADRGLPFVSVVTIVVRAGNPENIEDWDDLLRDDVEVVTPNPTDSGSAKWNLLAPYAAKSNGGQDMQAGLEYVTALVQEHVTVQPDSGHEATEIFLQGTGDVLLSYESEALFLERNGESVEHVTPPVTVEIESPAAVVRGSANAEKAQQFLDFLYTEEAQRLWGEAGFRPVDPGISEEFAAEFPEPEILWTIDDLGGWDAVESELFAEDTGEIAAIYDTATK